LPEFICNTSPLQYLHQLGWLKILPALTGRVVIPPAVADELSKGGAAGWDVPDVCSLPWIRIQVPASAPALPLASDLGRGEAGVLALALESTNPLVILDDAVARRAAVLLGLPLTGTLGLLVDAKKKGLIPAVSPALDELNRLRFRVSPATRLAVLKLAGELT
jgi:predicted nucleic acid-binding protein